MNAPRSTTNRLRLGLLTFATICVALSSTATSEVNADEAQWIWSASHQQGQIPRSICLFRKTFQLRDASRAQILITADDEYDLFVNGRRVARGDSSKELQTYDIAKFLISGRNAIAVRVVNSRGNTGALVARVMVQERNKPWVTFSTDESWKASLTVVPLWHAVYFDDSKWPRAQSFGKLGDTAPWDIEQGVATTQRHKSSRFKIDSDFTVERVFSAEQTDSLIAMTFNEFGHVIASRENGPLILMHDSNRDGEYDKIRTYCDKVTSCQGILSLNGNVFVTGQGPQGEGLYRLEDRDQDGKLETVKVLIEFEGTPGEHGAHGLTFGPDGLIYVTVGNHAHPAKKYEANSPHTGYYEGDLVGPRYEDPAGHATGVKAPGGVIFRTDVSGTSVQLVAGGLRNAYDIAFNGEGELFVHDSDMESDEGTTWYRPTQVFHVTAGAEFGWRSGWAKWNEHFLDVLPSAVETGRGSPTGAVFYNHHMFPRRYQNVAFMADWSEGRILAVKFKRQGATYTANSEVFLQGSPLNVTDLDVGPDGWLYFVTGGRGSGGGLYRVKWRGNVPDSVKDVGSGITAVIRQPQMQSAWARQRVAMLKGKLGKKWTEQIVGVALSPDNPAEYRTRAMDMLQLFGPTPAPKLLVDLSLEQNEDVRAKAAQLMGVNPDERTHTRLLDMLEDSDKNVRRKACEALLRADQEVEPEALWPLVASDDRHEAWAARRLLERQPTESWRRSVLSAERRTFIVGSLALLITEPNKENALDVLAQISTRMQGFVSDKDFVDMTRLAQIALMQGRILAEDVPELRDQFAEEFPAGNHLMNRELARLIGYLQSSSAIDRALDYLESNAPEAEKLHVALHLRFITSGWTAKQKLDLLSYFERAQTLEGGASYAHYVANATRDFAQALTADEAREVITNGAEWPNAALGSLFKLPDTLDDELLSSLKQLDRQILEKQGQSYDQLRIGIVAILAKSQDEAAYDYLREVWRRDPERRAMVSMGLAQKASEKSWPYLVQSLSLLEGPQATEVLRMLTKINLKPTESDYYRNTILCGLRLNEAGAQRAVEVLEHWTGDPQGGKFDGWEDKMHAWQVWFHAEYPDALPAELPKPKAGSKYTVERIAEYLAADDTVPDAEHGAEVFRTATCIKCHRFGTQGEAIGPDLSSLAKRFARKEIIESIVHPSHVISSQYRARKILTDDGKQLIGIVAPGAAGELLVLQSNGEKITVREDEIEENVVSKTSAMPDGLLDKLTLQEIADLMAYMGAVPPASITKAPVIDAK